MKKIYPLLSVLFLIYWGCGLFDEESYVGVTFGGDGNDEGYSVQQTTDGGYIITGEYTLREDNIDSDIWLIKTDSNGNKEWGKKFGDGYSDKGYSVQQTTDGGYIVVGSHFPYLIKTDSDGNEEWINNIGGRSVQQTTDGGYIIVGSSDLIKTDSEGNEEWIKNIGGLSVQQTTDGGYIIVGSDLIKTDSEGNEEWINNRGGRSVQQTTDGGYIMTSRYNDGGYIIVGIYYLIKTDSEGNEEWVQTFSRDDVGGSTVFYFNSVQQTTDGGYIITGEFYIDGRDVGLIKTDSNGNKKWFKSFNSFCTDSWKGRYCQDDGGNSVQQTSDGGYIITGFIGNTLNSSNTDIWLIKTDSKGNSKWNDRQ